MNLTNSIEKIFKRFLPSPFTIAVIITFITIILAYFCTDSNKGNHFFEILNYWENGIWNNKLLNFAYKMILILVLGHVLVLSKPIESLINKLVKLVNSTETAVILVSFTTMLVAFINWGLGLIFGAILARKVAEYAQNNNIKINYPIVGAAGYVGLMVWHSGLSGSAPLDAAGKNRIKELLVNTSLKSVKDIPNQIDTSETIFSNWNIITFIILLIIVPLFLYLIAKKTKPTEIKLKEYKSRKTNNKYIGAERLDQSKILAILFGSLLLITFLVKYGKSLLQLKVTLNAINLLMLSLCILFHKRFKNFLSALEEAIKGTSGILIQFPLYFGIMGIMTSSGMVAQISDYFVTIASTKTLPIMTFMSAGIVNLFVPSGGGQWVIQGPIILESALKLNVPLPKAIMAIAYGDQITNMLQPFWALPLLAITKLKAKEILPYTLMLLVVGSIIYITSLLII